MALNPELTTLPNGEAFPSPFDGEYFVLQRSGVNMELKSLPGTLRNQAATWNGRGRLILSSTRAVFVSGDQTAAVKAFDLPLVYIRWQQFNQPILGCNNLTGEVWSVLEEGGPSGSLAPIEFKFSFARGGVGTFLPLFFLFLESARMEMRQDQPTATTQRRDPPDLVATALVDPNDPTTLYLTQPSPSAPPIERPVYAKEFGKEETYQSME